MINRIHGVLRRLPVLLVFGLLLVGCGLQGRPKLDAADIRFAAFYSDYLSRSGVSTKGGGEPSQTLTSVGLDTLFARHGIDQKGFDAKLQVYSRDPQLWREVLEQVRKNLHKGE
ncbi:MAG: DUF4296 domain-containing protein [Chlorobiaceae bacterium]|nr:DUF4296 domain-containing protein [Chlorobiaceae bacterium]